MAESTVCDAKRAREASRRLAILSSEKKNRALAQIADALWVRRDEIVRANEKDLVTAEQDHLAAPLLKRLLFNEKKIQAVISGIESLLGLADPIGTLQMETELDEGLDLRRVSCPLGVIGVIFESRPDALVQIATLCLKSGNAAILKGGSEALHTNRILAAVLADAARLEDGRVPDGWITLWESREQVSEMLKMDKYIDLIIPRGSNEFVQRIMSGTTIPVMGHADGVCHLYIHEEAEPEMAVRIAVDSKTQYVAVCNAAETLLVDEKIAAELLPVLAGALREKNVVLHGCEKVRACIDAEPVEDWHHEYLNYEMSVRIVSGLDEAIDHINTYGSGHTEAIVTRNVEAARVFMSLVDSGNAFWNCSTRFSDGFRYGFGAEVGISTSKLHARGPVGLDGLVTYKYLLTGHGQIVADYEEGRARFTHKKIDINRQGDSK